MAEPDNPIVSLLGSMAMFKGMPSAKLELLAADFKRVNLEKDNVLFQQGEQGDSFYIILSGKMEIRRGPAGKQVRLATMISGDYFGEEALLYNQRRSASAIALEPAEVLRLEKEKFARLLRNFPQIRLYLVAMVNSRRLYRRKMFAWVGEDETVQLLARKHPYYLYSSLVLPLIVAWISLFILYLAPGIVNASLRWVIDAIGAILFGFSILWAIWRWIDWGNDYYIVTNLRVIWLEKVLGIYDSRQEAPLTTVLTVGVQSDQQGRLIGYGDVIVRTYTGSIVFHHVGLPYQLAGLIEEQIRRSKQLKKKEETAALERVIRDRLGLPTQEPASPGKVPGPQPARPQKPPGLLERLFGNFFKVQYEEGGVITFRKHWIVLLGDIWLVTLLMVFLIAIAVARELEYFTLLPVSMVLLVCITFFVVLLGKWLYEYVDWRNDIYQVTADQIIDIYRRPLGTEDKKTAPIENILSLEHKRNGILGQVFNYGNVTAMVGAAKFVFEGVYNPAEVEAEIFGRINVRKQAQKEAEAKLERERIADWLAAYHRQIEALGKSENPPNFDQNSE